MTPRRLPTLLLALLLALALPGASGEDNETSDTEDTVEEDTTTDETSSDDSVDEADSSDSSGSSDELADGAEESDSSGESDGADASDDLSSEAANETDESDGNESEADGGGLEEDETNESDVENESGTDDANESEPEDDANETGSDDANESDDDSSGDDGADDDTNESGLDDDAEEPAPTTPTSATPTPATTPVASTPVVATPTVPVSSDDEPEDEFEDEDDGFRTAPDSALPEAAQVAYDAPAATVRVEAPHVEAPLDTTFDALLEFVDANGNGAYDLGERVVQRFALADLPSEVLSSDGGRIARYALPDNGSLELRFRSLPDGATKYDVVILSFPFARDDTRIAFGASASAPGGVRVMSVAGEPAIASARGESVAYLSWVTTVDVDGATASVGWSVHTSTSETGETAILYWSYPRGDKIVHDPTLGIVDAIRETLGDARAFYAGGAAAIALLGFGYVLRRRPGE